MLDLGLPSLHCGIVNEHGNEHKGLSLRVNVGWKVAKPTALRAAVRHFRPIRRSRTLHSARGCTRMACGFTLSRRVSRPKNSFVKSFNREFLGAIRGARYPTWPTKGRRMLASFGENSGRRVPRTMSYRMLTLKPRQDGQMDVGD